MPFQLSIQQCQYTTRVHTPVLRLFFRDYPGETYQKGKPIWILLKQETVSGSGISWAICKSAPCSKQTPCEHPTTRFFTGRMPFLLPNQQRQSTVNTPKTMIFYCNAKQKNEPHLPLPLTAKCANENLFTKNPQEYGTSN